MYVILVKRIFVKISIHFVEKVVASHENRCLQ